MKEKVENVLKESKGKTKTEMVKIADGVPRFIETTEENKEGVSRGKWNGDQYVNEFANIKFNL